MALFQGIRLLVFLDVLHLVPYRRRARVAVVQERHPRGLCVEQLEFHILFDPCEATVGSAE